MEKIYLLRSVKDNTYSLKRSIKDLSQHIGKSRSISFGGDFYKVIQEIEGV